VIYYDAASDGWAQQLQRKVRYILLAQRAGSLPEYKTYLCVVTALQNPELSALLEIPWKWKQVPLQNDPAAYYCGFLEKNGQKHEVVAAAAPRMGMTAATILSMKMINQFRPRYLAMTGILAGVTGRCSLGDIIAADPSWDWGSGKHQLKKGAHRFLPAPYQIPLNSFIRSKLSLLSNDKNALDEIRRGWKGPDPKTILKMYMGPVASGASVLGDRDMAKSIVQQHRKLIGIEMESYGVFAAADESPLPPPKAFSIKSVSDFADADKSDGHQEYAAYTSSAALRAFVERFL
jgi:nucleoside phosphorylase